MALAFLVADNLAEYDMEMDIPRYGHLGIPGMGSHCLCMTFLSQCHQLSNVPAVGTRNVRPRDPQEKGRKVCELHLLC